MRSIDEQTEEVLRRAGNIKRERIVRRITVYKIAMVCAAVAVLIIAAGLMPVISKSVPEGGETAYGSFILGSPFLGYIVIGLLAFVLGLFVAIICMRLDKKKNQ